MVCKAVPSVHNAKQGKKPELPEKWAWVETSVWTDRMLAALENGVKGGKWFSLIDKISSVRTLTAAWEQVAANRGSAGVDRISIMEVMKSWTPTSGTPQGAVISPLLSNLYLHELDMLINGAGYTMVRYADDFVILCQNEAEAKDALSLVQKWVEQNGLSLHPEKTQVGDASKPGEGFAFLGYRFEAGKRYVRKKSMASLRERIRQKTKRSCGQSLDEIISRLNPMLKGWFEYFKHANKHTFPSIDGFVRRRLRSILRRQRKRSRGTGRSYLDHKSWPNAFFAGHGLFTMKEARVKVSQSR